MQIKKKFIFIVTLLILAMSAALFQIPCKSQDSYFKLAKENIRIYNPPRKDLAIIIDYGKSILGERLFVLDLQNNKVILSSRVSHAWKSGSLFANSYSNTIGSEMSSKGNYITGNKITSPKFGYAMLIRGLDYGINNNASVREIIFHSDKKMRTMWSNGCFATSEINNKRIIDLTYNGVIVCVID